MNRKDWYSRKYSKYIAAILFILAYILTIPIRGYEFLDSFVDTSQGVPLLAHLIIIIIGVFVVMIIYKIIEITVKR